MKTNYSTTSNWLSTSQKVIRLGSLAFVIVLFQLAAVEANAKEQRVKTSLGDLVIKHKTERGKSVFSQNRSSNPFATREQRETIEPIEWNERAPATMQPLHEPKQIRPAGNSSGGQPRAGANQRAKLEFADVWAYIEQQDQLAPAQLNEPTDSFDGTQRIFTRYAGNLYSQMWKYAPYNKIGKLYFKTPSGSRSYCTANVISASTLCLHTWPRV